jgi:hypothetical protein
MEFIELIAQAVKRSQGQPFRTADWERNGKLGGGILWPLTGSAAQS